MAASTSTPSDAASLADPAVMRLMPRVAMRIDPSFDGGAPALTQARVSVRLRDGGVLTQQANGARGYPAQPASEDELEAKFLACALRTLPDAAARRALGLLRAMDDLEDMRTLTDMLAGAT